MSSTSPSRILVTHTYAANKHYPREGEVIVVCLSQPLFGPGSTLGCGRDLPSHATRHNYHHAVVLGLIVDVDQSIMELTIFPAPAYSAIDPISGLSSTRWLLSQPTDYQNTHIPLPYEQIPPDVQPNPPFPIPAQFGDPIEVGGWKDSKPRWIQVVPMLTVLTFTTKFKCYDPPVKLNRDDVQRLKVYGGVPTLTLPVVPNSSTMPPFLQGGSSAASEVPYASSLGKDIVPGGDGGRDGAAFGASGSLSSVLQALYASDAVKQAFASLSYWDRCALMLDDDDDDDDDDDNDDWEDNMDPVTYARYYAAQHPLLARIVQDHDDKMRERLVEGIESWAKGVQPETV